MTAAGIIAAAALVMGACGGGDSSAAPTRADDTSRPSVAAEGASPLPAVDVVDVSSGETVALAGLLSADKPTLVWMWAPF